VGVPKGEREGQRIFEKIMAENFLNPIKIMNIKIQEVQQISSKMNSETHIKTHCNQTFKNQS